MIILNAHKPKNKYSINYLEYYTNLINTLKNGSVIWFPCSLIDNEYVNLFKNNGFNVITAESKTENNFYFDSKTSFDYVIFTPEYSLNFNQYRAITELSNNLKKWKN